METATSAAVLGDGAADAVARLQDALDDGAAQQVDLGQAAVAAEHVGVTLVAGEHHRGVRQVAEPVDLREPRVRAVLDDQQLPAGALHDDAEIARAARLGQSGEGGEQQE